MSRVVPLVALILVAASCAPLYDPVTVEHINLIGSNPVENCEMFLQYEVAKVGSAHDEVTERHIIELCSCYKRATNAVQLNACDSNVAAYVAYEEAKR